MTKALSMRRLWTCLATISVALSGCAKEEGSRPHAQLDLRPYRVGIYDRDDSVLSYNQIAFLSNRLLLVSINQRAITESVVRSDVDTPPGMLLLYDIAQKAVVKSTEIQIEKEFNSLQPLAGSQFVVWNMSGYRLCGADLTCGNPVAAPGDGPVIASPAGSSFMFGAYYQGQQRVFSTSSQTEIARYPSKESAIMPGDGAILLRREPGRQLSVKRGDGAETSLQIEEGSDNLDFQMSSRFLSEDAIGVSESDESLLVARVDGKPQYRIVVFPWYQGTYIFTSALGKRFGVRDTTYTRWNSIVQFYAYDRPYNWERIRVFDVETGRPVFEVQWDPRPYINRPTLPALSPDGHHLALIHHSSLNLYDIP